MTEEETLVRFYLNIQQIFLEAQFCGQFSLNLVAFYTFTKIRIEKENCIFASKFFFIAEITEIVVGNIFWNIQF